MRRLKMHVGLRGATPSILIVAVCSACLGTPVSPAAAEPLTLDSAAANACPECATSAGGARAINLLEEMGAASGAPNATYAGPAGSLDYAADAASLMERYAAVDASVVQSAAAQEASADVAGGLFAAAENAGALPAIESSVASASSGGLSWAVAGPVTTAFIAGFAIGTGGRYLVGKLVGRGHETSAATTWWKDGVLFGFDAGTPLDTTVGTNMDMPVPAHPYFELSADRYIDSGRVSRYFSWAKNSNTETDGSYARWRDLGAPLRETVGGPTGTTVVQWGYASDLMQGGMVSSTSVPSGYHRVPPAQTMPSRSAIGDALSETLNSDTGTSVARWLQAVLTGDPEADPTQDHRTVDLSRCTTDFETCESSLRASGLTGSISHVTAATADVNLGVSADAPISIRFAAQDARPLPNSEQVTVTEAAPVTITVNPSAEGMAAADDLAWSDDGASDPMSEPARLTSPWESPPDSDWRRWCEKTPPGTGLSDIDQVSSEFAVADTFPSNVLGATDLLFGTDDLANVGGSRWNDIQGFGLRKIAAKHGWGAEDRAETAATLSAPEQVVGPTGRTQRFTLAGASYSPNAARAGAYASTGHCRRIVVIDTVARPNEPRAREIITSYGDWTGGKP